MNLQRIYGTLPWPLQYVATTIYGAKLKRLRYGHACQEELRLLSEFDYADNGPIEALQEQRLQTLLGHAFTHVPHYRDLARRLKLQAKDVTVQTLPSALPILEKDEVRAEPTRFISEAIPSRKRQTIFTSGTTGSPLQVTTTRNAIQRNYAHFWRFLTWHKLTPLSISATFAGRPLVDSSRNTPPFWRPNPLLKDTQFSSYHLTPKNIPAYIRKLDAIQPEFIDAYPSSIYAIAQYIIDSGVRHSIRPTVVLTSSETLLDHQRNAIEEAFSCPARDQYGSAEMVAFAGECSHGSFHISPEYGILETHSTHSTSENEEGVGTEELIATGFLNPAMPLIRYRIGDSGSITRSRCACGRNTPILSQISGRTDDVIVTPNGARVGRLDPIFKGATGIAECQIVQTHIDRVTLRAALATGGTREGLTPVINALKDRLSENMRIDVEIVDKVPKDKNGKFRSVISHIDS